MPPSNLESPVEDFRAFGARGYSEANETFPQEIDLAFYIRTSNSDLISKNVVATHIEIDAVNRINAHISAITNARRKQDIFVHDISPPSPKLGDQASYHKTTGQYVSQAYGISWRYRAADMPVSHFLQHI